MGETLVVSTFKITYIFSDKDKIITNKQVGHMLRTKLSHVDEGGVAAGATTFYYYYFY